MARYFIIVLAVAYALVPPGICACRLEAWACSTSPSGEPVQPNDSDDDEDCCCLLIQHDCFIQTQTTDSNHELDDGFVLYGADLAPPDAVGATVAPSHFQFTIPASTPLYLKLRALLI